MGKYDAACAAFEESQRLDPQLATQFNIALCDEQLGKLASALAIYRELAEKSDNPQHKAKAVEMIPQLEARAARLRIDVGARVPAGLEVTVNGVRATNFRDMPIDLGTSKITAAAPGYKPWAGDATAKAEKQSVVITVTLELDAGSAALPPPPPPIDRGEPPQSSRKTLGLIGVVGGGAVLAGGLTAGLLARSKWHQAKDVCGGTICDTQAELDRAQDYTDAARIRGTISTVLVIAGGVMVAGGAVLWLTAPSEERSVALAPSASDSSVGLSLLGSF